ncbi:unnamed protein product [Albugo candida]|uniref:Uncharacterized protein n=1 Tax=Albugo candida TaxID=65357 RepID=A0A024GES7_9STRA|nr:unnamed protein product [Albugo candida]|eukprot:CCI45200.1 unnamed protein product [Albugo candida]
MSDIHHIEATVPRREMKYERLAMNYVTVNFMFEDENEQRSLTSHLLDIFAHKNATVPDLSSFVWFNVDDAFSFDRIDVDYFFSHFFCYLQIIKWHFTIHMKLSPNVWRSHMTNEHMLPLPHFQPLTPRISNGGMSNAQNVFLTFQPAQRNVTGIIHGI